MIEDWSKYPNFSEAEFACQGKDCCGGLADMDDEIVGIVQAVRTQLGKPLIISSGFRCAQHNNKISSTGFSGPHTTGKAIDILCAKETAAMVIKCGLLLGATGLGVSQKGNHAARFVHLDTINRTPHRLYVWSY